MEWRRRGVRRGFELASLFVLLTNALTDPGQRSFSALMREIYLVPVPTPPRTLANSGESTGERTSAAASRTYVKTVILKSVVIRS